MIRAMLIVSGFLVSLVALTVGVSGQSNTAKLLDTAGNKVWANTQGEASQDKAGGNGSSTKAETRDDSSGQGITQAGLSANQNALKERIIATPCSEKELRLSGEFQALFSVMREASGDTFLKGHFDAEGMTAQGLTSGRKYKAHGTSHINSRGVSPNTFNYVFNFALNKEDSFDSLMGHVIFRINVNSNGQATAEIVEVKIDC